jgi:hypothetical protein
VKFYSKLALIAPVLLAAICFAFPALAVDPPPFGGGSPDPIPVDGGASYLLAAGGVYAYRKLKARKAAKAAAAVVA